MDIIKVVLIGVLGLVATVLLRENKPEIAVIAMVATSVIILIIVLSSFGEAVTSFSYMIKESGLDEGLFSGILKIIGIGYITEYASNIAEDVNSKTIGSKIQLAGKVTIFLLTLPILKSFFNIIKTVITNV